MNKLFFLFLFLFITGLAQTPSDSVSFKQISDEILVNGEAYENLRELTKNIGHRLSGSENYEKASRWAMTKLEEAGADKVWTQEVMVPVWTRGKESLRLSFDNRRWKEIPMLSLGNSEGTAGQDIVAEVIRVGTIDDFNQLTEKDVSGKAVFFDYHFRQDFVETFRGYGDAAKYRVITASMVAKKGGKFVVIRSISTGVDDVPHTGVMQYSEDAPKIPAIAIGNSEADKLATFLLSGQKFYLKLNSNCGMKADKINHNVIGEITGKKDGKIIVVGGHLDSWDVGEGAHDDGAGIVQSIEILRAFKKLGIQPEHTLRVVCFANEENGSRGGKIYAETAKANDEEHIFALESDAGGFSPRGFALDMPEANRKQIQSWSELFVPFGVYDFSKVHGGVDIYPLKENLNTPLSGLVPDSQRYFDLHHTAEDVFEKVNKRELLLGATVMAQMIFMVDKYW